MATVRAIADSLAARKPDGTILPRDTLAGSDQGAAPNHRYGPPALDVGGFSAAAAADASRPASDYSGGDADQDGVPEPLGLSSELSPIIPRRGGGGGSARMGGGGGAAGAAGLGRTVSDSAALAKSRHMALLGPSRPAPAKIWRRRFVKLLVVGDSGLGKTTLISSLLNTAQEMVQVHDGTGTSLADFKNDPESLVTSVSWKDEDAREVWSVRVQDTPGYGDDVNVQTHIDMITAYVERQNRRWLEIESAKDRSIDMSEVDDPRVDVCIYCLPPHRVRGNDIRYMSQLGRLVPILPVVTKADTMTISEAQRFRQEVANRLQNPDTKGVRGRINTFAFSAQSLERAGLEPGNPSCAYPFVIISSNDVHQGMLRSADAPVFWPQRSYRWGTAEAFNPDHSDLLSMRALLMSEALEELVAAKRQRYEEWRRAALRVPLLRRLRRRAARLAVATLLPAAAVAFAAAHDFDAPRIKAALGELRDGALGRVRGGDRDGGGGGAAGGVAAAPVVVPYAAPGGRGGARSAP